MTDNLKGGLLMALGMGSITINDVFMRHVMGDLEIFQTVFLRAVPMLPLMALYMRLFDPLRVRISPSDLRLLALRGGLEIIAAVLFFSALVAMPLANVSAILQALPLTVTLAAALFLGHSFGWRRLAAILLGLSGVLIVMRPSTEGLEDGAIYALACVGVVTIRDLLTRKFPAHIPNSFAALTTAAAVGMGGGVLSIWQGWAAVQPAHMGFLTCAAVFATVAYIAMVSAMRVGEIAFVSPFRYTALVFAVVLGLIVFDERPDFWTYLGSALVVGTGLFTMYREHVTTRSKSQG